MSARGVVQQQAWVIDGWGSWEQLESRFRAADVVVFIDLPLHLHYAGATKRHVAALLAACGGDCCVLIP